MEFPSPNFGPRKGNEPIDHIIIHYTGMANGKAAMKRLCDPTAEVSAHYLIHEDGKVDQLVEEKMRAWHAGRACWHKVEDINSRSIGIEIINTGHDGIYEDFPSPQIDAVIELCLQLIKRHPVRPELVLGHSDIAPTRKQDPGEKFPWATLFESGIGHWVAADQTVGGPDIGPGDSGKSVENLQSMLATYGYQLTVDGKYGNETAAVICAFQRHFRQFRVDGISDPATLNILRNLLASLPT